MKPQVFRLEGGVFLVTQPATGQWITLGSLYMAHGCDAATAAAELRRMAADIEDYGNATAKLGERRMVSEAKRGGWPCSEGFLRAVADDHTQPTWAAMATELLALRDVARTAEHVLDSNEDATLRGSTLLNGAVIAWRQTVSR